MEGENGFRACTHNLLQNETLVGLTNQILQNVAYSVALFPVEPLTLCTRGTKEREVMDRTTKEEDLQQYAKTLASCGVVFHVV